MRADREHWTENRGEGELQFAVILSAPGGAEAHH